ncbi:BON domain-containing protein [Brevundimonas albigilva]|uniref:BON domain-containing protein n=1 Tax=Brevundimonas albigilva TaxID=1312364 RepID=UPI00201B7594|nr:BON domain-containing protein [Brevundimonas albigilva]UQV19378.1 BON domain-containing protein [Brevundimonas albigilva]
MADDRWRNDDNRQDWSEDRFRQTGERSYGDRNRYHSPYDRTHAADRGGREFSRENRGYGIGEGRSFDEGSTYGRSDYGRGYDYNEGYGRRRSRGYGSTYGQGYAGYDYERTGEADRRRAYGPSDWRDDRDDDRNWWDRTKDQVKAWGGDDDARRRREMDEVEHNRGRGPRGYTRSDERIREDVSDRLSDDWRVDASDIEVTVAAGEVTLSGTVGSREDKRRAEDITDDCSGVKHVQNNLRVKDRRSSVTTAPEVVRDVTDGE